jgi:hypothetical protein
MVSFNLNRGQQSASGFINRCNFGALVQSVKNFYLAVYNWFIGFVNTNIYLPNCWRVLCFFVALVIIVGVAAAVGKQPYGGHRYNK